MIVGAISVASAVLGACEPPSKPRKSADAAPAAQPSANDKLTAKRPAFIETQPLELRGACNMEALDGKLWGAETLAVDPAKPFVISGWGADDVKGAAPDSVVVRLQDDQGMELYVAAQIVDRPDLVGPMGKAFYQRAGYTAKIQADQALTGMYQAMMVMKFSTYSILCASGRKLKFLSGTP